MLIWGCSVLAAEDKVPVADAQMVDTIITSFPRRWGRNKPDPSAVHRAIRDHFGRLDNTQKHNVYDLALVIIDECSRVFFDRTKPLDQRPEVFAIFGSAISDIVSRPGLLRILQRT